MGRIKVLLVDDHELFREGVHKLLDSEKSIQVIGEAADGREAIEKTGLLHPDVVVMDLAMPGLGGIETTRHLKATYPKTHVLILSMHDHKDVVIQALGKGASGYVVKRASSRELVRAIKSVWSGETYLSPALSFPVEEIRASSPADRPGDVTRPSLTHREREVLRLVADGFLNKQIAAELGISVKTIEVHKHHIMCKLQMYTTAELTKYAVKSGIADL